MTPAATSPAKFTPLAIIGLAVVFWVTAQNASGSVKHVLNLLLLVLLASMVLLNWSNIRPLIFQGGANG